jgi:hypothetical protein
VCDVWGADGVAVSKVVGFDRYVEVGQRVERACAGVAAERGGKCSEARLILLQCRKPCGGEVYEVVDGEARLLLE